MTKFLRKVAKVVRTALKVYCGVDVHYPKQIITTT